MIAADLFLELASFACKIYSALQAVLLELTLHLQAQLSRRTSSQPSQRSMLPFQLWQAFMDQRIHLTISSYLQVCSATFAKLSASLLIIYIQMNCQNRSCVLQVTTLNQLVEEERKSHLAEVKKIQSSLQQFSKVKNREVSELQIVVDRLSQKLQKYKGRCCTLNEKVKQQLQAIKTLNKRLALSQELVQTNQDSYHRQKMRVVEQLKVGSELRQVIALQETQNKQLKLKIGFYEQQIQNLEHELEYKIEAETKMKNVQFISEDQYQREAALLRQNLKLQFNKNTNELLGTLSSGSGQFINVKQKGEVCLRNQAEEQLQILANMMEYGSSFMIFDSEKELSLANTRKILSLWQQLLRKNQNQERQMSKLQEIKTELTQEMKNKLDTIQQMVELHKTVKVNTATQTPNNDTIEQLIKTNGFYRIKLIQFHEVLGIMVHFVAFLLNLKKYSQKKIGFYRKVAQGKIMAVERKETNRFRAAALSILFIQSLKKKAKTSRRNFEADKYRGLVDSKNASFSVPMLKCLSQRQTYTRKNPILESLLKQKAKTSQEQILATFIHMTNEQTIGLNLSSSFTIPTDIFDVCRY